MNPFFFAVWKVSAEWNDAPTRTQDQVVAALIKASEIAEGQ